METLEDQVARLMRQERWAEAIQLAESNLHHSPASRALRWDLGWAYFKISDYEKAVLHLRVAAELSPESYSSHWPLAFALLETGDIDAAKCELTTALALRDHYLAWQGLALLYQRSGDLESAERTHLDSIQSRPESRERVESYADFLSDTDRVEEARAQYARAASLWPESALDIH